MQPHEIDSSSDILLLQIYPHLKYLLIQNFIAYKEQLIIIEKDRGCGHLKLSGNEWVLYIECLLSILSIQY